jgi:ABC-type lipoprotein export system ATPase subunit
VLVDFDFALRAGEFVVVNGPSGVGKSILLHIASCLDAPAAAPCRWPFRTCGR